MTPPSTRSAVGPLRRARAAQRGIFRELLGLDDVRVYLHGSVGDETAGAFSDVDDLILLGPRARGEPRVARALAQVERRMQIRDPLQHHGHFIADVERLETWDSSLLPLCVLNQCVVVQGPAAFACHVDAEATRHGQTKNLRAASAAIASRLDRLVDTGLPAFILKELVSGIALLPAYAFQRAGVDIDKPTAIKRVDELAGDAGAAAMAWATEVRARWDDLCPSVHRKMLGALAELGLSPHHVRAVGRRLPSVRGCPPVPAQAVRALLHAVTPPC